MSKNGIFAVGFRRTYCREGDRSGKLKNRISHGISFWITHRDDRIPAAR